MKRLSINRIAAAGLRADQRGYRAMAAGIFLSIFFIATLCQCAWGVYVAAVQGVRARMGQADAFYFDADEYSDADIMDEGSFDRLGHIAMTAQAGGLYIGSYDETAASIMDRRYASGRAPEKAGEMAAEKSFLDHLSIEAEIGESFELTVTPIDGLSEKRTYTLTGVLEEQTSRFEWKRVTYLSEGLYALPAALVSAQETPFDSGRTVVQRVMTLKKGVSLQSALAHNYGADGRLNFNRPMLVGLNDFGALVADMVLEWGSDAFSEEDVETMLIMLGFLGGSLMLACCVGISGAMEGQLARKTKEIGMLRAVGATRRQIRRIFGREAWILALIMAPVSIACACLAVWGLSRAFPSLIAFEIQPMILAPIAVLSIACIVLSAFVPLRRASQVMPMGVLRDTALLRRIGRVKSRNSYKPARLIAWRQNRLHPLRPLGAGALTGLMLVCMISALGLFSQTSDLIMRSNAAFRASFYARYYSAIGDYYTTLPDRTLSGGDMAQIAALPGVEKVKEKCSAAVCWLTDSLPRYLADSDAQMYLYALSEEEALQYYRRSASTLMFMDSEEILLESRKQAALLNRRICRETGVDADTMPVPLGVIVMDDEELRACAGGVVDGAIDMDAINRGEQVLLCAPDRYVRVETRKDGQVIGQRESTQPFNGATLIAHNDGDFKAGQTLELMLLTGPDADWATQGEDGFYAGLEKRRASVTVGAVLNQAFYVADSQSPVTLLTTRRGLNAMGFSLERVDELDVYTDGSLSDEEEKALSEKVESILRRADNLDFHNELEAARVNRRNNRMVMTALLSVALLFFAVAVSMITGGVTRRIRSDARMIGTLRAVGANAKTVADCYRLQILLSIALGLLVGLWSMASLLTSYYTGRARWLYIAAPACVVGFSALCYAACMLALRSRIRETISHSIVENIREM